MLNLSYTAGEHLAHMLADADAPDDAVIRISVEDGELELATDTVRPGDTTFTHAEKTVLAIDDQISRLLENNKLDVNVTDDQPELIMIDRLEGDECDD